MTICLNKVRIDSIERVEAVVDTYNFNVENAHTYIAENAIAHNINGPGGGKFDDDTGMTDCHCVGGNNPSATSGGECMGAGGDWECSPTGGN